MDKMICKEVITMYNAMEKKGRLAEMNNYIQHGSCTTLQHVLGVAYLCLYIYDRYNIKCDRKSLLRAALLHDYFLYDWHDKAKWHRLHGFRHGKFALKNAIEDFDLSEIEKDGILHHMFPITAPPKYIEGMIIMIADKICATYEMCKKNPYNELYLLVFRHLSKSNSYR